MDLDDTIRAAWAEAERAISPRARRRIADLQRFLCALDNPHAELISGQVPTHASGAVADATSALTLEGHIIGLIRSRDIEKAEAADWLRILHLVICGLRARGISLHETRLPAILPSTPSPFSPGALRDAARIGLWRDALHRWITSSSDTPCDHTLLWGAVLFSAVLHGALLDSAKLGRLIEHVGRGGGFHGTRPRCYFEFDMPFAGLGELHLQRWFPDALTTLLLHRLMRALAEDGAVQREGTPQKAHTLIRRFLSSQGVGRDEHPAGLKGLADAATGYWRARASSLEIGVMARDIAAHAIHRRSWRRLFGDPGIDERRDAARKYGRDRDEHGAVPELFDNLSVAHHWFEPALSALGAQDIAAARSAIETLSEQHSTDALATRYLAFIHFLLEGHSATGKPLALSTIRTRVREALHRLLFHLGSDDPAAMTLDDLQMLYGEIANECEPDSVTSAVKTGLREFHCYLVRKHGLPHIRRLDLVLGDDAHLMPVDANLVSVDEYLAAQSILDANLASGASADDVRIAKLVLMIAFRLGLRRMEIFGLRIKDIQLHRRTITVLVREYDGHRLKTANSKRTIPADALLDPTERKMLRAWAERREREVAPTSNTGADVSSERLLAIVSRGHKSLSHEGISDRVYAALREATGDRFLFIHHLRHSFATWTHLRLLVPDHPEISAFFSAHPATERWLTNGRRLRLQLLGHAQGPSRVHSFAVARLLGHSSPTVSMGHYVHCSEIVMAATVDQELHALPRALIATASTLPLSTALGYLAYSPLELVRRTLARFPLATGHPLNPPNEHAPGQPRGRPALPPAHQSPDWLAFSTVRAVLHLAALTEASPYAISIQLQQPESVIRSIMQRAPEWAKHLGLEVTENRVAVLPKPRLTAELTFLDTFEVRLARLYRKAPELCRAGLALHLRHFNRQKHDVVFKGVQDAEALSTYLHFIRKLGFRDSECQCVLRTLNADSYAPDWVPSNARGQLPPRVRRIGPPSIPRAATYAKWLGIQLTEAGSNGLGYMAGFACMIGALALNEAAD